MTRVSLVQRGLRGDYRTLNAFIGDESAIISWSVNMYPPCEAVSRRILPVFRSLVAKELIENCSYTQSEVAKRLGTTQAAVSQYIHSKRGDKTIAQFERVFTLIQDSASEAAKCIATEGVADEEVTAIFCRLCRALREK